MLSFLLLFTSKIICSDVKKNPTVRSRSVITCMHPSDSNSQGCMCNRTPQSVRVKSEISLIDENNHKKQKDLAFQIDSQGRKKSGYKIDSTHVRNKNDIKKNISFNTITKKDPIKITFDKKEIKKESLNTKKKLIAEKEYRTFLENILDSFNDFCANKRPNYLWNLYETNKKVFKSQNFTNNEDIYMLAEFPTYLDYNVYKREFRGKVHILFAHKTANINGNFFWRNNVLLMKNTHIKSCIDIYSNTIIGPNSVIDAYCHIGKNNIIMENVSITRFTYINDNNIFHNNVKIGYDKDISFIGSAENFNKQRVTSLTRRRHLINNFKDKIDEGQIQTNAAMIRSFKKYLRIINRRNEFRENTEIGCGVVINNNNLFEKNVKVENFVYVGNTNVIKTDVIVNSDVKMKNNNIICKETDMKAHKIFKNSKKCDAEIDIKEFDLVMPDKGTNAAKKTKTAKDYILEIKKIENRTNLLSNKCLNKNEEKALKSIKKEIKECKHAIYQHKLKEKILNLQKN